MTIYAVFVCAQLTGVCQIFTATYTLAGIPVKDRFETLAECQQFAKYIADTAHYSYGRSDAKTGTWVECRKRHVETWDPAQ